MAKRNYYIKLLTLLVFMVANVITLKANHTITINNKAHELVAPAGTDFQWFYNGKEIQGAKTKHLVPNESGTYSVTFVDENNHLAKHSIAVHVDENTIIRIFIIGDSTVQNYGASSYPQAGWGQVLHHFFEDTLIAVSNRAIGGRSSRSFYEEGRWDGDNGVVHELDSCSYLFIQFGHNDRDFSNPDRYTSPDSMKHFLRIYVNESREQGATPVLVSPMNMNAGETNVFTQSGSDYRGAMLDVSEELDVPFIDLNMKSYDFYQQVGVEYAKYFIHLGLEPGEYPNYPNGSTDFWTHYQEMGALAMARFITEEIVDQQSDPELTPLADALKPLYDVSVALNDPDAGVPILSGEYPEGATVTLKARLNESSTLYHWIDGIGNDTLEGSLVTFTMEARDYDFTGIITDCLGMINGTAVIDECGVCTGGATGIEPCTGQVSFVEFCETNTNVQILLEEEELYRLVMNTKNINNAFISQSFDVVTSDTFLFAVTYRNLTADEAFDIYVDESLYLSDLSLETGEEWKTVEFDLYLEDGEHTVEIRTASPSGGVLLDYLALYSEEITKGGCTSEVQVQQGVFVQQDSLIVIEAENFTGLQAGQNGDNWVKALFDDASAEKIAIAPPGTSYGAAGDAESDAPVLSYKVDFPYTGEYEVWARVYAFNASADSYHLGLDGEVLIEKIDLYFGSNIYEEFTWLHVSDKKLEVTNTGVQSLDLFCREPDLIIDKIILTRDANYAPDGYGPEQTVDTTATSLDDLANNQEVQMMVYPNPAKDQIQINYNLGESNQVNISVLDLNGQPVAHLLNARQSAGNHEITWNLNNSSSAIVPAGMYLIRLQSGNTLQVRKVLIH